MRKYKSSDEPERLPGDNIVEKSKLVEKSICAEDQVEICLRRIIIPTIWEHS